jgi:hypothetical protein
VSGVPLLRGRVRSLHGIAITATTATTATASAPTAST